MYRGRRHRSDEQIPLPRVPPRYMLPRSPMSSGVNRVPGFGFDGNEGPA